VDYFAAFGSDIVTARSTADVKPTAFHMTAGRQKFLNSIQKLGNSMKKDQKKHSKRLCLGLGSMQTNIIPFTGTHRQSACMRCAIWRPPKRIQGAFEELSGWPLRLYRFFLQQQYMEGWPQLGSQRTSL
jgi:hypothetical protein